MKKKLSIIVLIVIMCMTLSSCGLHTWIWGDVEDIEAYRQSTEDILNSKEIDIENKIQNENELSSQELSDGFNSEYEKSSTLSILVIIPFTILIIGLTALGILAQWKMFVKAGEAGWKCLIPFYNLWTMFKIVYGEGIRMFLTFIPFVGFIFFILFSFDLSDSFGKHNIGFKLGLLFLAPVFYLMLGLNKNIKYIGPKRKI